MNELIAIDYFFKGTATLTSWSSLKGMNNLAQTFADEGVGIEAKGPCEALRRSPVGGC